MFWTKDRRNRKGKERTVWFNLWNSRIAKIIYSDQSKKVVAWRNGMKGLQWSRRMETFHLHWHGDYRGVYSFIKTGPYFKYVHSITCKLCFIEFLNVKVGKKGYILVQMWSCFYPENNPLFLNGLSMLFLKEAFSSFCNVSISSSNSGLSTGILVMTLATLKTGISLIDTAL